MVLAQTNLFGTNEPIAITGQRVHGDYYPTPEAITKALIEKCFEGETEVYSFFEPCAGNRYKRIRFCHLRLVRVGQTMVLAKRDWR